MAKVSLSHKRLFAAYRDVFESPNGQAVLEDMKASFQDRSSYVPGADPYQIAFNEGQRSVYLRILINIENATLLERPKHGSKSDNSSASITVESSITDTYPDTDE